MITRAVIRFDDVNIVCCSMKLFLCVLVNKAIRYKRLAVTGKYTSQLTYFTDVLCIKYARS